MSKENAVKFLNLVNQDKDLHKNIIEKAANLKTWVATAASAGLETSTEDLTAVIEQLVGKSLKTADDVMGALHGLFEIELDESALDGVSGGARTSAGMIDGGMIVSRSLSTRLSSLGGGLSASGAFVREGGPMGVSMPGGGFTQGQ